MLIGLFIFVAGGLGAGYAATRNSSSASSSRGDVEVLYTAAPIDVGTAGAAALSDGRIASKRLASGTLPADAVTSVSEVSGRVAAAKIPAGTVVTAAMFPPPQTRIGTVVIPKGMRALSLELASVPGVSGFAGAGDRIDVYRVAKGEGVPPGVHLELQNIEILNVNGGGLAAAQGQPSGANLVYLVAVTPADAERLIYLSQFEKMYFDLVPKGEPSVSTPGAGPGPGLLAT
ncbi:MAG TPA: Flp pilus assembly protein CpaB [Acidimicrobiales bacterium]